MKQPYNILLLALLSMLLFGGCLTEDMPRTLPIPHLVVDGRIETGRCAEVVLTINKEFDEEFREEELLDYVVRWALVTVSCGEESETLVGYADRDYPTRFLYRGNIIEGREGEEYRLTINYSGREWSATTTIPRRSEFESLITECVCGTLYRISAVLPANGAGDNYLIECAIDGSNFFRPTLMGVLSGGEEGNSREITINRPIDFTHIEEYTTLFKWKEKVVVRLSTMGEFGFNYWNTWENNSINSLNPIFPANTNLPTNMSGDATGIWCGYGSSYYKVKLE